MKNPDEIINDPLKSTLFGKFYERIVSEWLKNIEGFDVFEGKPRVYWADVDFNKKDEIKAAEMLNDSLRDRKENKKYCTPDGLLTRDGEFYLWEAKNWPLWSEGKEPATQLRDVMADLPQLLAKKCTYRKQGYKIDGFIFSWWKKPPESDDIIIKEYNEIINPGMLKIYYTSDILSDCIKNKYEWYLEIIETEKERMNTLFKDLSGIE